MLKICTKIKFKNFTELCNSNIREYNIVYFDGENTKI